MNRWLARSTSALVFLLVGCGHEDRHVLRGLLAPDPGAEPLVIEWESGQLFADGRFKPTEHFSLELNPSGRFRYEWRDLEGSGNLGRELVGSWRQEADRTTWILKPDLGRDALEPGEFAEDELPRLQWWPNLRDTIAGQPQTAKFLIPCFRPATGRLSSSSLPQTDARMVARMERE